MEALLIAPLDPSAQRLRETVIRALEASGVRLIKPEMEAGADLGEAITDAIASADLVIPDVSRGNPNVFYELGYAHAMRKNTILLVSNEATPKLPTDLNGMFYRTFDPQNLRELGEYITRTANSLKARREAIA
jgi:predicted nucleotide-binding protein